MTLPVDAGALSSSSAHRCHDVAALAAARLTVLKKRVIRFPPGARGCWGRRACLSRPAAAAFV